jgi:EVE domain
MRYWIGVATKNHVNLAVAGGFCQIGHGKAAPLKRMAIGDWIIYYSPKKDFESVEQCQAFTAIGQITGDEVYEFNMAPGFIPFRRDARFLPAHDVLIRPLLGQLSFIKNKSNWGSTFRFGHFEIPAIDFELIAKEMLGYNPAIS